MTEPSDTEAPDTDSTDTDAGDPARRLVETLRENEKSALEAVREFVDTVDGAFPSIGENAPRRQIIDAAFRMTEQLVDASNQVALNIVQVTEDALVGDDDSEESD